MYFLLDNVDQLPEEMQEVVRIVVYDWSRKLRFNNGRHWIVEEMIQEALLMFLEGRETWRSALGQYLRTSISDNKGHNGKWGKVGDIFDHNLFVYDEPPVEDSREHAAQVVAEKLTERQQELLARSLSHNNRGGRNVKRVDGNTKKPRNNAEEMEAIGMIAEVMQELPILLKTLPYPRLKLETTKMKKKTRYRLGFCPQCGSLPPMGEHFCSDRCQRKYSRGSRSTPFDPSELTLNPNNMTKVLEDEQSPVAIS